MKVKQRMTMPWKKSYLLIGVLSILASVAEAQSGSNTANYEIEFWQTVKDSDNAEMLKAYLTEFPNGQFESLARIKLKELTGGSGAQTITSSAASGGGSQEAASSAAHSMSPLEKECFEAFQRQIGLWWQRNIVLGDNDSGFDHIPCLPFVSKDLRTWVGSTVATKSRTMSETDSESGQSSASTKKDSATFDAQVGDRQWCVTRNGTSNRIYSECLNANGIPTWTGSGALVDRATAFFREYEKQKAFAISTDGIGDSGWWPSEVDAVRRALFECFIKSSKPRSCRVINVNGKFEEHFDDQKARDPAFGATGSIESLIGNYYFEMNLQGLDGTLQIRKSGSTVTAKLETCIEGICTDWTLEPEVYQWSGRRFQGLMKRGAKSGGWRAKEVQFSAAFSEGADRVVGTFGLYYFEGRRRSSGG